MLRLLIGSFIRQSAAIGSASKFLLASDKRLKAPWEACPKIVWIAVMRDSGTRDVKMILPPIACELGAQCNVPLLASMWSYLRWPDHDRDLLKCHFEGGCRGDNSGERKTPIMV